MRSARFLVLALSLGLAGRSAWAFDSLNIGDPAPEIKVARWVKGSAVEKFKPGRIYVVEFWATWCGPCRTSIPHLTELDHQYRSKGVTFIGVDVWEPEASSVKPFVAEMGAKMGYNVAIDSVPADADPHDGAMSKSWLAAAGEVYIPTAFAVVGGKVVWIGSPMNLDKPLAAMVAGTWDSAAFAKQREERRIVDRKTANIEQHAVPLFKAKKYQEFLKSLEKITAGNEAGRKAFRRPETRRDLQQRRRRRGPRARNQAARRSPRRSRRAQQHLPARHRSGEHRLAGCLRVVALALKAAKRAVALSDDKNAAQLDTMALAQSLSGHPAAALASEQKAIKALEPDAEAERKAAFNERLQRYRKAVNEKKANPNGAAKK